MLSTYKKFHKSILDILFPIKCISCKKEGFWICHKCFNKIHINTEHYCSVCQTKLTPNGKTCISCKRVNHLDGMIWATNYREPIIAQAIHLFKYRFIQDLHYPLGNLILKSMTKTEMPIPDLIIPIALHPRRLRWRGFNQSELLAKIISNNLLPLHKIPIAEDILMRQKNTKPQMEIKRRKQRQQNISGAFSIKNSNLIENKTILLIDDVSTTGSTIFECAKILKSQGAKEVFAAIVAKQEVGRH
ncbi:MAG: phosphoribosyltransferase [uncultured bacterium]|nr:MAG: phosphoribosyltransferase [uncultured bacterium]